MNGFMNSLPVRWLGGMLLALLVTGAIRAEVSIQVDGEMRKAMIMMAIIEGGDPVGQHFWSAYRTREGVHLLNASGAIRGDGKPAVSNYPDGRPLVVWAYKAGLDHDIAVAEWQSDNTWSPT